MKISYNWLKWYIPEAPTPEKLVDIFNYHLCEMESLEKLPDGDVIFDIKVLPNRAHDLLSHQGVARELASLLNIKYNDPTPKYKIPESKPTKLEIKINTDKCRRYMGRIVRNVKVEPSPEWVVKHLESIGQRSINNIVDAANIVMYDCGQPIHAFDLDKMNPLHKPLAEHIGIRNVHERLQRQYGKAYGLTLESIPGAGTTVTIRIPKLIFMDGDLDVENFDCGR